MHAAKKTAMLFLITEAATPGLKGCVDPSQDSTRDMALAFG
jgi:hypothetical protein